MIGALLLFAYVYPLAAISMGLVLDLLYGLPMHVMYIPAFNTIPFTVVSMVCIALLYLVKKYLTAGERRIKVGR